MMGYREGGGPGNPRGSTCVSREERAWEVVGGRRKAGGRGRYERKE